MDPTLIKRGTLAFLLTLAGSAPPLSGQSITSPYDFVEHSQAVRVFEQYWNEADTTPELVGAASTVVQ